MLWKKGSRVNPVKSLLRNYVRMQHRLSGFFNMAGTSSRSLQEAGERSGRNQRGGDKRGGAETGKPH